LSRVSKHVDKENTGTEGSNAPDAYPDLIRSLTPNQSPMKSPLILLPSSQKGNSIRPTYDDSKSSKRLSTTPAQVTRSYLSPLHDLGRAEKQWRFKPLVTLQRKDVRRGSIIFNDKGLSKELPDVPYVEISARGNIVSRRRLTRVPIRFHVSPGEILASAHVLPWQEITCSITDCLPSYDHLFCNPHHCSLEHIK
jgi:hypothetical protein